MSKKIGKLLVIFFLFINVTLFASTDPYIEIQLDRERIIQDQVVPVHFILYSDKEADEIPTWEFTQSFISSEYQMMSPHRSRSITYVNGVMSEKKEVKFNYTYLLRISKSGKYQLSSPQFKVDGYLVPQKSLIIEVTGMEKNPFYTLRIDDFPSTIFVGQRINFNLDLFLSRQISTPRFRLNGFDGINHSLANSRKLSNPTKVSLNDKVVEGEIVTVASKQIFRIPLSLVVKETGLFSLDNGNAGFKGVSSDARMSFFGEYEQSDIMIPLETNTATVRVLPLPQQQRPSNFSGLIGEISFNLVASPLQLKVGDPITLTIEIDNINDFSWDIASYIKVPEIQNNFKIADAAPGKIEDGKKIFIQTLRPLSTKVTQVPSISLNFFNTKTKRYEIISSQPILIEVAESTTVNEDQIIYNSVASRELATSYSNSREFHNIQKNLTVDNLLDKKYFGKYGLKEIVIAIVLFSILFLLVLFIFLIKSNLIKQIREYKSDDLYQILNDSIELISNCTNNNSMILAVKELHNRVLHIVPKDSATKKGQDTILKFVDQLLFSNNQIEYGKKESIVQLLKNVKASLLNAKKQKKSKSTLALTILFFIFSSFSCADKKSDLTDMETLSKLLDKANAEFASALELLCSSDESPYLHFKESYDSYEAIVAMGYNDSQIEFNMGNISRFLKNDPMALYHYKRALLLKEQPIYKEAVSSILTLNATNIQGNPFVSFLETIGFLIRTHSLFTYLIIFLILAIVLALVFLLKTIMPQKNNIFKVCEVVLSFIIVLLLMVMVAFLFAPKPSQEGVVLSDVEGRGGPSYAYNVSLTTPLYPTQLFKIIEYRDGWLYIALPNGIRCWIPQRSTKIIQ